MKVVILCGGQGTRLREETDIRPKPMVDIGGRPILWHIMRHYARYDLNEFVLCLGYKGWMIKEYFLNHEQRTCDLTIRLGQRPRVELHDRGPEEGWSVTLAETGEPTLTGGRLWRVRRYLPPGPFCLTYADGLSDVNLAELIRFHQSHGKLGTVTGARPPGRFGELQLRGQQVTAFAEKPQVRGFINGGFFVFEREFIDRYLNGRDDQTLEQDPLERLAADGQLMMFPHEGFWQMMDTYREWKLLEELWNSGQAPWRVSQ